MVILTTYHHIEPKNPEKEMYYFTFRLIRFATYNRVADLGPLYVSRDSERVTLLQQIEVENNR